LLVDFNCNSISDNCDSITCPYGIQKNYDKVSGCEQCECFNPCSNYKCAEGMKCFVNVSSDGSSKHKFNPSCKKLRKPRQTNKPVRLKDVSEDQLNIFEGKGYYATLRCHVEGFPPPVITWKQNGNVSHINLRDKSVKQRLVVHQAEMLS